MITFIESGNRIATENFETGEIYTITYTNGNYRTMCCIGIGTDFVMFQGTSPNALFCLTLGTSETVSTIELGGGGSGTMNYNELENKPQINGFVLIGNKTASDLNLVSQNDLDNYVTDTELSTELASKQDTLTTTQLTAVNSGITSSLVSQITTNKNNILSLMTPKKGSITWETGWTPTSENVSIRQYDNIIVGQIYCRFSTNLPTTPDTQIGTINIVGKPRINFRGIGYVSDQLYDTPTATANVFISESTGGLYVLSGTNNAQAIRFNFVYCTSDST